MIRLTDGTKTVEITMHIWEGNGYAPDWSLDYFEAGGLEYDDESGTYWVEDVDYCIDQAKEWEAEDENNVVDVAECATPEKRYFVADSTEDVADLYGVYETAEEAEKAAASIWEGLTSHDQKRRTAFYVGCGFVIPDRVRYGFCLFPEGHEDHDVVREWV